MRRSKYVGIYLWAGYPWTNWRKYLYFVRDFPRVVKEFCARGYYGWAGRDWWNIDDYLAPIIVDMVAYLRDHTIAMGPMGLVSEWIPDVVFNTDTGEFEWCDGHPASPEYFDKIHSALWGAILTAIVEGFEAWQELVSYDYQHSIDGYPGDTDIPGESFEQSMDRYGDWYDKHREEINSQEEVLQERFNLGMSLFKEYYGGLWD
jgi:hypothetical protein